MPVDGLLNGGRSTNARLSCAWTLTGWRGPPRRASALVDGWVRTHSLARNAPFATRMRNPCQNGELNNCTCETRLRFSRAALQFRSRHICNTAAEVHGACTRLAQRVIGLLKELAMRSVEIASASRVLSSSFHTLLADEGRNFFLSAEPTCACRQTRTFFGRQLRSDSFGTILRHTEDEVSCPASAVRDSSSSPSLWHPLLLQGYRNYCTASARSRRSRSKV